MLDPVLICGRRLLESYVAHKIMDNCSKVFVRVKGVILKFPGIHSAVPFASSTSTQIHPRRLEISQ